MMEAAYYRLAKHTLLFCPENEKLMLLPLVVVESVFSTNGYKEIGERKKGNKQ